MTSFLAFVDRDIPMNVCRVAPNHPFKGIVLHHTAGGNLPFPSVNGSWHWIIDKDGTIFRDVSEENCAFHAANTNRFRPAWVVPTPAHLQSLSDINFCSIGIEIVYAPQNGERPTAAELS